MRAGRRKGVAQLYIQKPKKQWQYLKSVRIENGQGRKERGRMMAEVKSVLGITIMCLSVPL